MSIWRALHTGGKNLGRWLADGLLPQRCLVCRRASGTQPVCAECNAQLPSLPAACCPVCALPLQTHDPLPLPCGRCLTHPPAFDATLACYAYAHPVDVLIQSLKYQRRLASADFLARGLCHMALTIDRPVERIIAMPLAPARLAERGFNQAVELARPVAHTLACRLDMTSAQRIRPTAPQVSLPWAARTQNMRHAFACTRRLDGEHVLVIDDVMTTGTTLAELARTLKAHGAARVTNLVVARTLRHDTTPLNQPA